MPIYKLSSNALGSFLNITLANVNANTATVSTVTSNNLITSLITVNNITSSGIISSNATFTAGLTSANVTVTGYLVAPVGDTSQRPAVPSNGMFRYNTTTGGFEGYKGSWGTIGGGGATGGGSDEMFYLNGTNVTASYSIPSGKNAMTAGPVTVNDGVTVTVPDGSAWTIV